VAIGDLSVTQQLFRGWKHVAFCLLPEAGNMSLAPNSILDLWEYSFLLDCGGIVEISVVCREKKPEASIGAVFTVWWRSCKTRLKMPELVVV
jgi:hypothetical protein